MTLYELSNEELYDKASRIITRLQRVLTDREINILRMCILRCKLATNEIETTTKWAQEAFDENKRLVEIINERWQAGWKGDKEYNIGGDFNGTINCKKS